MVQATWNGAVIADSDATIVVEGNHYFPPGAIKDGSLAPSDQTSVCPWKGTASYYDVVAGDDRNAGAAWYYPDPKPEAEKLGIKDHIAFWKGVEVK